MATPTPNPEFNPTLANAGVQKVSSDIREIRTAVDLLFKSGVVELRSITGKSGVGTISGYYDLDAGGRDALVRDTAMVGNHSAVKNTYWTLQGLTPGLPNGLENKFITNASESTKDRDVAMYQWLLVDCDPKRAAGVSASIDEKAAAEAVILSIRAYLSGTFNASTILADSGNGYHLQGRVNLANTPENEALIKHVLLRLAFMFGTDKVDVDTTVFNPSRICKAYGTPAKKGENTLERPHRLSRVLDVPAVLPIIPVDVLKQIAGSYSFVAPTPSAPIANEKLAAKVDAIEDWLNHFGIQFSTKPNNDTSFGGVVIILQPCPFDSNHGGTSAAVTVGANGGYGFTCKHNGCSGRGFKALRAFLDPDKTYKFARPEPEFEGVNWVEGSVSANIESVGQKPFETSTLVGVPKSVVPVWIETPPPTIEEILTGETTIYTDHAFGARVFFLRYGHEYAFSITDRKGEWMRYTGQLWVSADKSQIRSRCERITADIRALVAKLPDDVGNGINKKSKGEPSQRDLLRSLARLFSDSNYINYMLQFFEGKCSRKFSEFDGANAKHLFNFTNGTYDLKSQSFRDFKRDDLVTQMASAAFKPDSLCPTWDKFLQNSFPLESTRLYLQRFFGYAMTATGEEKAAPILHGLGDNGKTVMLDVLVSIFGTYAQFCGWKTFAVSKYGGSEIRNDLARLHNARLVVCDESSKNMELDEATFKAATGNSTVVSRFLNKEYFEYVAGYKLVLATNNRPRITCADRATWARIHDVEMNVSFPQGDPNRIDNLKALLMSERDGIAAWLVKGHTMWREQGLNPPPEILESTARYQEHSDIQAEFFTTQCVVGDDLSVRLDTLYAKHREWLKSIGETATTKQEFEELVESRKFKIAQRRSERGKPMYVHGLDILTAMNAPVDSAL